MEDKPPDCKYKNICDWYKSYCCEWSCWRAKSLDGIISESKLEKIIKKLNIEKLK